MANEKKELWENSIKGNIFVKTYDVGGKLVDSIVRSGKKIAITAEERRLNQEMAANKDLDFFANGMLRPVDIALIEDAQDYEEIASNPNLISDSEMKDLFKLRGKAFKDRIEAISNTTTLDRVKEIAEDDATAATVTQVKIISERLATLTPQVFERETLGSVGEGLNVKPISAS